MKCVKFYFKTVRDIQNISKTVIASTFWCFLYVVVWSLDRNHPRLLLLRAHKGRKYCFVAPWPRTGYVKCGLLRCSRQDWNAADLCLKFNGLLWKILWKKCSRELWSPHSFVAVICFLYLHAWLLSVYVFMCVVRFQPWECWNPCSCWWLKILLLRSVSTLHSVMALILLHFAWVVDDAKCIVSTHICVCVCLSVCLSVCGRMPTLLHGPGCNFGEW